MSGELSTLLGIVTGENTDLCEADYGKTLDHLSDMVKGFRGLI